MNSTGSGRAPPGPGSAARLWSEAARRRRSTVDELLLTSLGVDTTMK